MELEALIQTEAGSRTTRVRGDAPIVIGRDTAAQLRLDSDLVSRRHVVVVAGANAMVVEDRSTNGTLAGGQLLRRNSVEVPYGTPIVVGEFTVSFRPATPVAPLVPAAGRPPPPRPPSSPPLAPPSAVRLPLPLPPPPAAPRIPAPPSAPAKSAVPPTDPDNAHPPATSEEKRARGGVPVALRKEIHQQLIENLDLASMASTKLDDPSMRPKVLTALRRIVDQVGSRIAPTVDRAKLVGELADEALGLGPLEALISDPSVSEIMVVDAETIYVERKGKIVLSDASFTDDDRVRAVIERIVTPLGRRIDESSPLVDARLKDGSRVNAVIKPIALRGSCITIRKFSKKPLDIQKLIDFGAITEAMARFLERCVMAKKNIVISGGTGSGKTTLLNVLSGAIPSDERIVTIEDAAELQLQQPHVVSLETRPANMEGKGEYSIRDLLKNAMRMRPDRIVVGECRGGEALDMLQAMNTGHDGSLTTTHSNSPREACKRLETLALMAGIDLPSRAIREQIAGSVNVIVQQSRFSDGSRKVNEIAEVIGLDDDGAVQLMPIFKYVRTGTGENGKVLGAHKPTGYLPSFLETFILMGLVKKGEAYL